jgi:hypothetical protein
MTRGFLEIGIGDGEGDEEEFVLRGDVKGGVFVMASISFISTKQKE